MSDTTQKAGPDDEGSGAKNNAFRLIALIALLAFAFGAVWLLRGEREVKDPAASAIKPMAPANVGENPWARQAALPAGAASVAEQRREERPPPIGDMAATTVTASRPRLSPVASLTRKDAPPPVGALSASPRGTNAGPAGDGQPATLGGLEVLRAEYIADASRYLMPGDVIQCLTTAPLTERSGATFSALIPNDVRGRDGNPHRPLIPAGSRAVGKVVSGMVQGERRMAAIFTHIEGPTRPHQRTLFVRIGTGQAGDELGGVDLAGNIETHFWPRLAAVGAYALLDMTARVGSGLAGAALNEAIAPNGTNGPNINIGNFGGMNSGRSLAGQAFDHEIQRKPTFDLPRGSPCSIRIQQPIFVP